MSEPWVLINFRYWMDAAFHGQLYTADLVYFVWRPALAFSRFKIVFTASALPLRPQHGNGINGAATHSVLTLYFGW